MINQIQKRTSLVAVTFIALAVMCPWRLEAREIPLAKYKCRVWAPDSGWHLRKVPKERTKAGDVLWFASDDGARSIVVNILRFGKDGDIFDPEFSTRFENGLTESGDVTINDREYLMIADVPAYALSVDAQVEGRHVPEYMVAMMANGWGYLFVFADTNAGAKPSHDRTFSAFIDRFSFIGEPTYLHHSETPTGRGSQSTTSRSIDGPIDGLRTARRLGELTANVLFGVGAIVAIYLFIRSRRKQRESQ